jgi:hypothetical protein
VTTPADAPAPVISPAGVRSPGGSRRDVGVRWLVANAEILGVVAILGAFTAMCLWVAYLGAQLGYDEAVYASKTRSFVTDIAAPVWRPYRPPGLPIVGLAAVPFGLGDASLRTLTVLGGTLAIASAWGLARLLWNGLAAAIALLALVAAPVVLAEVALFHNDLPSAAPVVALLALLWWEFERRETPGWLLVLAGPLAAAAFYLRFGALAILVGIALVALLLWARRALRALRVVTVTILVTVALFLPHVIEAIATTGSPLGIVRAAVSQVDTTSPMASALQYLRWLPGELAGIPVIILGIVAVLAAAHAAGASIRLRRTTPAARRLALLLVPAGVAAVGTVLVSHAEARYVLTPLILVAIAGSGGAAAAARWLVLRLAPRRPRASRLVMPAILLGLALATGLQWGLWARGEVRRARVQYLADAGRAVAADAGGPCVVVSSISPVLGWYSGCYPRVLDDPSVAGNLAAAGEAVYVVLTTADARRNVAADTLAAYRKELTLVEVATTGTSTNGTVVYRVVP